MLLTDSNKGGCRWIGRYLQRAGQAMLLSPFVSQGLRPMAAPTTRDDLAALMELTDVGKVTPVIDRTFPLAQVADALRYYGTGHAHGKVIISVAGRDPDGRAGPGGRRRGSRSASARARSRTTSAGSAAGTR
jgi:hypothetical protein